MPPSRNWYRFGDDLLPVPGLAEDLGIEATRLTLAFRSCEHVVTTTLRSGISLAYSVEQCSLCSARYRSISVAAFSDVLSVLG